MKEGRGEKGGENMDGGAYKYEVLIRPKGDLTSAVKLEEKKRKRSAQGKRRSTPGRKLVKSKNRRGEPKGKRREGEENPRRKCENAEKRGGQLGPAFSKEDISRNPDIRVQETPSVWGNAPGGGGPNRARAKSGKDR